MLHRNSTRLKKGEIFGIVLQTFFNLLREDHATVFFTHFDERNPKGCESFCKKRRRGTFGKCILDLKLR